MKKLLFVLFSILTLPIMGQQQTSLRTTDRNNVLNYLVFDNSVTYVPISKSEQLLRDSLKLKSNDEFVLKKVIDKDNLGFTHLQFEQRYKGIKVKDGLYSVHGRNGKIEYIGGEFKRVHDVDISPKISEQEALNKALSYINASKYRWQIPSEESKIKIDMKDSLATYFPKGEMIICQDVLRTNSMYRLAYMFDIFACNPLSHKIYYIDAITGEFINEKDRIIYDNASASGPSLYYGNVSFVTDNLHDGTYRLYETRSDNNVIIHTYDANHVDDFPLPNNEIRNNSTSWSSDTALDAHWAAEKVFDYWDSIRHRNSINENGMAINSYVHFGTTADNADNAGWDGSEIVYGDGLYTFKPLTALDIAAHEIGHGIMQYTSDLSGPFETNSINEGFSDIWAAVVEHWVLPNSTNNWLVGEKVMQNGKQCLRSLRSPKTEGFNTWTTTYPGGFPNTYTGSYWLDPSNCYFPNKNNDFCYCHTNNTVLDYWFYLLSQGGSSSNDLYHNYTVFGLGIDSAAKIVWRAESINLSSYPTAQYSVVKDQTIRAAEDLYGTNSMQAMQVRNAWYAVGVGTQPTQMTLSGPWLLCSSGGQYTVNNPVSGTLTWHKSSNIDWVSGSNPATFRANGFSNSSGWIQAYYDGIPGPKIDVWVGTFNGTVVTGTAAVCPSSIYTYTAQVPGGHSSSYSYSWTYPSNWLYPYKYQNTIRLQTPASPNYGTVRVAITNACGTSSYSGITVYPSYNCGRYFTIYPNPASTVLTITLNENKEININDSSIVDLTTVQSITEDLSVFKVHIYNNMGILVSTFTRSGKNFNIPLINMRDGTYIIELINGENSYREQFIVKHN